MFHITFVIRGKERKKEKRNVDIFTIIVNEILFMESVYENLDTHCEYLKSRGASIVSRRYMGIN